ncbi:MAG: hypothetical protein FWD47_15460 [Treponema sp.]|nr:hypothetical protein [Treponema sp.]
MCINNAGQILYAEDDRYCDERIQLIRMYKMLQKQVIDTFQYVEPVKKNENVFSLRYHQLYGNICAEIETNFRGILKANGYTNGDENNWNIKNNFFKTNIALKLNEYKIESYYNEIFNSTYINQPFSDWNKQTYSSLKWYQEHNAVKHYRSAEFENANLKNVLTGLTGLYILLFAQFGHLVDTITDSNIIHSFDENNNHMVIGINNDMGFNFKQIPAWTNNEEYSFEWNNIKTTNNPYLKYNF